MKFTIKKRVIGLKKAENITFNSLEIDANVVNKAHFLNNNQKKNRVVYSFTKSRSDFDTGGAKPYRQKGTGHARQGTKRSPLKVGGSVIFGPKPRVVTRKLNKQFKFNVLKQVMLSKVGVSSVYDGLDKVKKLADVKELFMMDKIYLFIIDVSSEVDTEFFHVVKNLPNVYFNNVHSISAEDLIRAEGVVYSISAFDYYFGEKAND